jgi:hypothetical protein
VFSSTALAAIRAAVRRTLSRPVAGNTSVFGVYPVSAVYWWSQALEASVNSLGEYYPENGGGEAVVGRLARVSQTPEDIAAGVDARPLFKFIGSPYLGTNFAPNVGDFIMSGYYRKSIFDYDSDSGYSAGGLYQVVRVEPVVNNPVGSPITCYVVLKDSQ